MKKVFSPDPLDLETKPCTSRKHEEYLVREKDLAPITDFKASSSNYYKIQEKSTIETPRISFSRIEEGIKPQFLKPILQESASGSISYSRHEYDNSNQTKTLVTNRYVIGSDEEVIFSNYQNKKRYLYIEGIFRFSDYTEYKLDVFLDTRATTYAYCWKALPIENSIKMENPISATGIDENDTVIEFKAKNIAV